MTSHSVHTQPPWEVDEAGLTIVSKTEHPVHQKVYRKGFSVLTNSSLPIEVREANVALAARAPELLEENEMLKQRIAELESLSSACSNALHKQSYIVTSHKELMLKAAEELAFACEEKTLNECLNCFSQNPDCSGGVLVNNLHQAATGDCPIAMERFNEAKKLVEPNNNTWHRVGNLEIAPVEMWKFRDWFDGQDYCRSLECFMPDQEQLQMILEDDVIRVLTESKRIMNRWIWSSSENNNDTAWGQRPSDDVRDIESKTFDRWVVPCRKANVS